MPNEHIRKEYNGASPATTISGALSDVATAITVASGTGLPTGSTGPFVMVIDRGLATEEKVLVTTRAGTALQSVQRGYDGTTAQAHLASAAIEHCLDAYTLDQVNSLANAMSAQYDLVMRGASANAFTRIPVGADNNVLSVQGGVPSWTAPGTASIADGSVTLAKLAAAVQALLVPAGTIVATVAATADTGWLFGNQAVTSAQSLYPALWAAAPASWKSGSTLNIPDLTDTTLVQTGGSAAALGAVGGAMTATIAEANLPSHVHNLGSHTHTGSSGNASADHSHAAGSLATSSSGDHEHGADGGIEYILQAAGGGSVFASGSGVSVASSTTTANAGAHTHTMSGSTAGQSVTHNHTVTVNAASGNTGSTGSGTALTVRPRHLGINFQIKAH